MDTNWLPHTGTDCSVRDIILLKSCFHVMGITRSALIRILLDTEFASVESALPPGGGGGGTRFLANARHNHC